MVGIEKTTIKMQRLGEGEFFVGFLVFQQGGMLP